MFLPLWAFFSISVYSYIYEHSPILKKAQRSRPKHLDGKVCSCPPHIVAINPPKDTEKYIADNEVVWSNINFWTISPREQTTETVRGRWFVIRVPPQKSIQCNLYKQATSVKQPVGQVPRMIVLYRLPCISFPYS